MFNWRHLNIIFHIIKGLNKYSKRIYKTTKNLLTGATDKDEDYQLKAKDNLVEILSFWHPNLTINLVDDHSPWQPNSVPPPLNERKSSFFVELSVFNVNTNRIVF